MKITLKNINELGSSEEAQQDKIIIVAFKNGIIARTRNIYQSNHFNFKLVNLNYCGNENIRKGNITYRTIREYCLHLLANDAVLEFEVFDEKKEFIELNAYILKLTAGIVEKMILQKMKLIEH